MSAPLRASWSRWFGCAGLLFVSLLAGPMLLGGCNGAPSGLPSLAPGQPASDAASDAAVEKVTPDVDVRTVSPDLEAAEVALESEFDGFLERDPLGFDQDVFAKLGEDAGIIGGTVEAVRDEGVSGLDVAVGALGPAAIIGLFLLIFVLVNRQFKHLWERWQSRLHIPVSIWLTAVLRTLVVVGGRALPLLGLVLLSYFPVQAIFDRQPWTLLLTDLLWLGLLYRALQAAINGIFAFDVVRVDDAHAARLSGFAGWALRLVMLFLMLQAAANAFDYRPEARAFLRFALRLSIAIIPAYLYATRASVLALFPEDAESSSAFYRRLRRGISRYYYWLLTGSILLLGLWAAGYTRAATFILLRGYGILLLVTLTLVAGHRLRAMLGRRIEQAEIDDQVQLFESLDAWLRGGGLFVLALLILDLLGLYDPLEAMLRLPIIVVGRVEISPFSIISATVVIAFAVLVAKIVRAVLTVKVFPAFGVDVGVGYAINTLLTYALVVVGFFLALTALGVNLSAMTVLLASLGVGIGFGLQNLTENLISGFILLFGRSVKKGDFITIDDTYGQVEAVGARSVLVKSPDNYDMLIPSKAIVGQKIINWSYRESLVRLRLPVGVTYSANPREVEAVLIVAAGEHPRVLEEPAPEVWLTEFGDSSVNFELLVYFDCRVIAPQRLRGQLNFIVWDKLHEAGIEIPFPQRDLHFKSIDFGPEIGKLLAARAGGDAAQRSGADAEETQDGQHGGDDAGRRRGETES